MKINNHFIAKINFYNNQEKNTHKNNKNVYHNKKVNHYKKVNNKKVINKKLNNNK